MPDARTCPFGAKLHPQDKRHMDPYTPTGDMARQCTCGSRRFVVSFTPGIPLSVICARANCAKMNRTATMYERGREAGPRVRTDAGTTPAF